MKNRDVKMRLDDLMRDKVILIDEQGNIIKDELAASVQSSKIITKDMRLPIKPGYHFLRTLPSGLVEDFIVIDPGYRKGTNLIPDTYQSSVRRSDIPVNDKQTIIQNINGSNNRVYAQSTDNSTNIGSLDMLAVANLAEKIKQNLDSLPEQTRSQIPVQIGLIEQEIKSDQPNQSAVKTALASIKNIAEGAGGNLVAIAIIGMIAKLLGGA